MTQALYRAHPWHGITVGEEAPDLVYSFIEILPTDVIKYEIHKPSGHIFVDRPLTFSSQCPTLYGFIPQTYAAERVAEIAEKATGDKVKGDGDPIDICVLTERPITRGGMLMKARPIGGIRMIDKGEADDKLIAVLHNYGLLGQYRDIKDCPEQFINRLKHYFLTYKDLPGSEKKNVYIAGVYGAEEAKAVIRAGIADYRNHYSKEYAAFQKINSEHS